MSIYDSRKTAAPAAAPGDHATLNAEAEAVARKFRDLAESGQAEEIADGALQQLMSAAIAVYAAKADGREQLFPLAQSGTTNATAVLMATSALLKGSSIELFELGMWQTWSGMK